MKIISIVTGFALLCSLGAGAVPAHASDFDQVSIKVHVGDLDLSTSEGAKAALSRIHKAAQQICGPDQDLKDLNSRSQFDQCVSQAVDRAVASLDRPMVTAANGHHTPPVRIAATSR